MDNTVRIEAYFDGSLRDNIAIGAWRFTLYKKRKCCQKEIIEVKSGWDYCYNSQHSIQAELIGLINLLDNLRTYFDNYSIKRIIVKGDCKGAVGQVNRKRSNLRHHKILTDYVLMAKEIIDTCQIPIDIYCIPREKNEIAHSLCKKAWKSFIV